jgi:homoserine/homoserine lactone efflux protein
MLMTAIPILLTVSLVPGLCVLLALNLGLQYGVGRTLWMMAGELCAVTLIALFVLLGLSAFILDNPLAYLSMKILGSAYLAYIGASIALSGAQHRDHRPFGQPASRAGLTKLGFMVAASNPKPWIFYTATLPALMLPDRPLMPQALQLVGLLIVIELGSLLLYASGGHGMRLLLANGQTGRLINMIMGGLIVASAVMLLVSA